MFSGWVTPLDRLPQPEFEKRLQAAIKDNNGVISNPGDFIAYRVVEHSSEWVEAVRMFGLDFPAHERVNAQVHITQRGEICGVGRFSWSFHPCSQCGQTHAKQRPPGEKNLCTDCVAKNVATASRKSSADYRKRNRKVKESVPCIQCGQEFTPKRSTAQFCGPSCRVAHHRALKAVDAC